VVVGAPRFYRTASQVAAEVLESLFCERGRCDASRADRFTVPRPTETVARVIPLHGAALPGTPKRISDSP